MQQLADQLNISIGTVSRALSHDPAIAARTRKRVQEAASRLGYRHNLAARALITGRTTIIGIHVRNFNSFYVEMALRLERIISAVGYMAVVHSAPVTTTGWVPDGEIMLNAFLPLADRGNPPRPLVGSLPHPTEDYVSVDFTTPTAAAIQHLHSTGCRRIAMLSHAQTIMSQPGSGADPAYVDDRVSTYYRCMEKMQLPIEDIPLNHGTSLTARETLTRYILARGNPDALLCHNDDAALGAYRAALDCGLRVPMDISIIGCDGVEFGDYLAQPLSTIVQPLDERAAQYWKFLVARMKDPTLPQQRISLPTKLLLRQTSR